MPLPKNPLHTPVSRADGGRPASTIAVFQEELAIPQARG